MKRFLVIIMGILVLLSTGCSNGSRIPAEKENATYETQAGIINNESTEEASNEESRETVKAKETEEASNEESRETVKAKETEEASNEESREAVKAEETEVITEMEVNNEEGTSEEVSGEMKMKINDTTVLVKWEENDAVKELMKITENNHLVVQMSMYGGFEQVGSIGTNLPRDDKQTTTKAGDIVLYSGNQLVVFYGSNSWAYTRLGSISDKTAQELADLLGNGDVTITIER